MRRRAALRIAAAAVVVAAAASPALAQTAFKVPFKFESGQKKFAPGDYLVAKTADGQVTFRQLPAGKETTVPVGQALAPGETAAGGPRLVFDEVGNFEPSYTEYFTVYVLAEVWLSDSEGYLVHTTKGAHKSRVVKAEPPKR